MNTRDRELRELKRTFESAIARWDRRNKNPHAGALALLRLDEAMQEIAVGKPVINALEDNFNDRLLIRLKEAFESWCASAEIPC